MKLIRDKLALTPAPDNRLVMTVDRRRQRDLIIDKLLEEAHEVWSADSKYDIIEELADLSEAFYRLLELHDISLDEVERERERKRIDRGGFEGGYVLL